MRTETRCWCCDQAKLIFDSGLCFECSSWAGTHASGANAKAIRRAWQEAHVKHVYVPGKIVEFAWGYDQTNIDYFVITKRTGQFVSLQAIAQKNTDLDSPNGLTGHCVPLPDVFLTDKKPFRRKVHVWQGKEQGVAIKSYGWASLWDGKPSAWTGYA